MQHKNVNDIFLKNNATYKIDSHFNSTMMYDNVILFGILENGHLVLQMMYEHVTADYLFSGYL